MNHMKEIARMLGVELGEEFKVKCQDGELSGKFCIIDDGLYERCKDGTSLVNSALLRDLLIGRCEIIKLPRKPTEGTLVYFTGVDGKIRLDNFIPSRRVDLLMYKAGMVHRTQAEAEAHKEEDKAFWDEIRKELEE